MAEPLPVAILVEDERQIRRFVRTALEAEGWSVHETDTLRQGLVDSGTRKPDLIILDLGMPDGDGMEFLRDLRGWSNVPVIVLSARVGEQDKIEALDAGADDYLTKPSAWVSFWRACAPLRGGAAMQARTSAPSSNSVTSKSIPACARFTRAEYRSI